MAHYQVIFETTNHGTQINHFETFNEAQKFWNDYADVFTDCAGEMLDLDTDEVIWEFDELREAV